MTLKVTFSIEKEFQNIDDIKKILEMLSIEKVEEKSEEKPIKKTGFEVLFENNRLIRRGRPTFPSTVYKNIKAKSGLEDRRHILHGATQITDVLIDSFNRVLASDGIEVLHHILDNIRNLLVSKGKEIKTHDDSKIEEKAKEIITIAFGREENLVAGLAVQNRGIERARQFIKGLRDKLNYYCAQSIRSVDEMKNHIIELIKTNISHSTDGEISLYKNWILKVLKKSLKNIEDEIDLLRLLNDFEFSCTLDIEHENTTKTQNIWGLTMANKLHRAIQDHNEEAIFHILLGE